MASWNVGDVPGSAVYTLSVWTKLDCVPALYLRCVLSSCAHPPERNILNLPEYEYEKEESGPEEEALDDYYEELVAEEEEVVEEDTRDT